VFVAATSRRVIFRAAAKEVVMNPIDPLRPASLDVVVPPESQRLPRYEDGLVTTESFAKMMHDLNR